MIYVQYFVVRDTIELIKGYNNSETIKNKLGCGRSQMISPKASKIMTRKVSEEPTSCNKCIHNIILLTAGQALALARTAQKSLEFYC